MNLFPNAAQARSAGHNNAMQILKVQQFKQDRDRQNTFNQTAQQASSGGSYDPEQHAKLLESKGMMREAFDLRKLAREESTAKSNNAMNQLNSTTKTLELLAKTAPLIQDDQQYQNFKAGIEGYGIVQPGMLPPQWDEQARTTVIALGKNAGDKFEVLTGDKVTGLGFDEGTVLKRNTSNNDVSVLKKPKESKLLTPEEEAQKIKLSRAGSNSVTVNNQAPIALPELPKLDKGFVYKRKPDGSIFINGEGVPEIVPITGSNAEREIQKSEEAKATKEATAERFGNVVLEDIDRAVNLIDQKGLRLPVTELFSKTASTIPGTDAHQLSQFLQTIKANAGFDRLQAMRDASPTGGALGQVSERELGFLQAAIGSLEQSQRQEDLVFNLNRVKRIYNEIIHGEQPAAENQNAAPETQNNQPTAPQQSKVINGVEYVKINGQWFQK